MNPLRKLLSLRTQHVKPTPIIYTPGQSTQVPTV